MFDSAPIFIEKPEIGQGLVDAVRLAFADCRVSDGRFALGVCSFVGTPAQATLAV